MNKQIFSAPEDFNVHPKLAPQRAKRAEVGPDDPVDWGQAEALAFGTLLTQGRPLRLTGQDSARGTFSQRHLVLVDVKTGKRYAPVQHLEGAEASFEIHNSPLSEQAAVGFEYGYGVQAPETLVMWEAQFGDFVNAAQVAVDQFIVSGLAKWGETSRLTLLLPHGYEGAGPGALERPRGAVPDARRRGQHPRRERLHPGPVLPPAAPAGAGGEDPAADRVHAQEPAAQRALVLDRCAIWPRAGCSG